MWELSVGLCPKIIYSFWIKLFYFILEAKAKDKYPDFKYIDILNSQLQSFQLKFTERLENRLRSKTIKVVLSNRKLTGRKRIAFDNKMHKIVDCAQKISTPFGSNYSTSI
jgi:disulfide oxidoreductase YuzD